MCGSRSLVVLTLELHPPFSEQNKSRDRAREFAERKKTAEPLRLEEISKIKSSLPPVPQISGMALLGQQGSKGAAGTSESQSLVEVTLPTSLFPPPVLPFPSLLGSAPESPSPPEHNWETAGNPPSPDGFGGGNIRSGRENGFFSIAGGIFCSSLMGLVLEVWGQLFPLQTGRKTFQRSTPAAFIW